MNIYDMAQHMGGGVTLKTQYRDSTDSGNSGNHILDPSPGTMKPGEREVVRRGRCPWGLRGPWVGPHR